MKTKQIDGGSLKRKGNKMENTNLTTASEVMNFNRKVIETINNNFHYIHEVYQAATAEEIFEYCKESANASDEEFFGDINKEQFLHVCTYALNDGYYSHAGSLCDLYEYNIKLALLNNNIVGNIQIVDVTRVLVDGIEKYQVVEEPTNDFDGFESISFEYGCDYNNETYYLMKL